MRVKRFGNLVSYAPKLVSLVEFEVLVDVIAHQVLFVLQVVLEPSFARVVTFRLVFVVLALFKLWDSCLALVLLNLWKPLKRWFFVAFIQIELDFFLFLFFGHDAGHIVFGNDEALLAPGVVALLHLSYTADVAVILLDDVVQHQWLLLLLLLVLFTEETDLVAVRAVQTLVFAHTLLAQALVAHFDLHLLNICFAHQQPVVEVAHVFRAERHLVAVLDLHELVPHCDTASSKWHVVSEAASDLLGTVAHDKLLGHRRLLRLIELTVLLDDVRLDPTSNVPDPFKFMDHWLQIGSKLNFLLNFAGDTFDDIVVRRLVLEL